MAQLLEIVRKGQADTPIMSDIAITINLPEELVERIQNTGWQSADQIELTRLVEKAIRKQAASERLRKLAEELRELPSELKPSPEAINAAVAQARHEIAAEPKQSSRNA